MRFSKIIIAILVVLYAGYEYPICSLYNFRLKFPNVNLNRDITYNESAGIEIMMLSTYKVQNYLWDNNETRKGCYDGYVSFVLAKLTKFTLFLAKSVMYLVCASNAESTIMLFSFLTDYFDSGPISKLHSGWIKKELNELKNLFKKCKYYLILH